MGRSGWLSGLALWFAVAPAAFAEPGDGYLHAYVAQATRTRFNQIIRLDVDLRSTWLVALGAGRTLREISPRIRLEGELQWAQHWGQQHHSEYDALVAARWHDFGWDRHLPTTIALGTGLSYATGIPPIEAEAGKGTHLLQFLVLDLDFSPQSWGPWSAFLRVHHRSGVFGLISNADGSNFVGLGVRLHRR